MLGLWWCICAGTLYIFLYFFFVLKTFILSCACIITINDEILWSYLVLSSIPRLLCYISLTSSSVFFCCCCYYPFQTRYRSFSYFMRFNFVAFPLLLVSMARRFSIFFFFLSFEEVCSLNFSFDILRCPKWKIFSRWIETISMWKNRQNAHKGSWIRLGYSSLSTSFIFFLCVRAIICVYFIHKNAWWYVFHIKRI